MKEIGGYFKIELSKTAEYYPDAIKLNSGRNALYYILKAYKPTKIFIPYYICNSVLEPIQKLNIDFEFYHIDDKFSPIIPNELTGNQYLLYVNYFGVNIENVNTLSNNINNLIVDNSQAFFYKPTKRPTFYSPRKFFGVPDGAYLFSEKQIKEKLIHSVSHDKASYLLKRFDLSSEEGYEDYKKTEEAFTEEPIKLISHLTQSILSSINYEQIKKIREENFQYIHNHLQDLNELSLNTQNLKGPMKYPFLISKEGIKEFLIENMIYVSTYWKEVLERVEKNTFEYKLTKFLLPLPIDQRYNKTDMDIIIRKINEALKI